MILKLNEDGTVERVECSDESVWNVCRKELDGGFLEPVYLPFGFVMMVDEDGYCKQLKVNPTATLLYDILFHAEHFILGKCCFARVDGEYFVGLSESHARGLEGFLAELRKQSAAMTIPNEIPPPNVSIESFDTVEELFERLTPKRGAR